MDPDAERVAKEAAEKVEAERVAKEAAEKVEAERVAKEAAEKVEAERVAKEAAEKAETERLANEKAEADKKASDKLAADPERYAIIEIDDTGKIMVLDTYADAFSVELPSELIKKKTKSVFAIKIIKGNSCSEDEKTKCITYDGTTYTLNLSTAVTKEEAEKKLIKEDFLASVSVDTGPKSAVDTGPKSVTTTVTSGPKSVTGPEYDDGCADNVQDISGNYHKETRNIEKISDFYKYIPFFLFLNDILRNNKKCSDETKTTIHTIMDEIYMMPITFGSFINNTEVNKITDINDLYELMQFVNTTSGYDALTADVISKKLEEILTTATNTTSATTIPFKMIAPSNASLSCWLNSALMAYLVPLYVACSNDVTKLKQNVIFADNQLYIVNLIHEYIDAHFGKTDRNGYNGDEIIRKIKEYIVRPTVVAVLNTYLEIITPDGTNNQHTFLSSDIFHFDNVLNGKQAFTNTTPGVVNRGRTNVVPLMLNAKTVKIENLTLTIDSETYEIGQDIRFITFNNEASGEFGKAVKNFLTMEITVGNKTYEQVSFIMAGRGHYVVVTKIENKYYMIDDLPPTITEIDNVSELITNRSKLLKGYYTVGIVYILKDRACPENETNVLDSVKLVEETNKINAENTANDDNFKNEILEAINIYDVNTAENTDKHINTAQLNTLKNILQRLYPDEYKKKYTQSQPGGSRKNRLQKSKKTKRKYYVYK